MRPSNSHPAVALCKEDVEVSKSYVLMVGSNTRNVLHGAADRHSRVFYYHMLHFTHVVQGSWLQVQHLIERCLLLRLSREDCVRAISKHAKVKPAITLTGTQHWLGAVVVKVGLLDARVKLSSVEHNLLTFPHHLLIGQCGKNLRRRTLTFLRHTQWGGSNGNSAPWWAVRTWRFALREYLKDALFLWVPRRFFSKVRVRPGIFWFGRNYRHLFNSTPSTCGCRNES